MTRIATLISGLDCFLLCVCNCSRFSKLLIAECKVYPDVTRRRKRSESKASTDQFPQILCTRQCRQSRSIWVFTPEKKNNLYSLLFVFVFLFFFLCSELVVNNVLGRVHIVANTGGASFCICLLSRYVLVAHRLFLGCSRYVLLFSRRLEKRKLSIRIGGGGGRAR